MRVALTSDCGLELDLAYGNAYALLEALGMATDSVGEIPLEQVRNRLADPDTPARAAERGVDHYLPRIEKSEEHTSELQSLMRISYAVFCLKKKKTTKTTQKDESENKTYRVKNKKKKQ